MCYRTIDRVAPLNRTVSFNVLVVSSSSFGQTEPLRVEKMFDFGDLGSE